VNGNRICSFTNLELKGEGKTAKDLKGAGVGWGKRWVGGGCTNENKRGGEEVRRGGRWSLWEVEKGNQKGRIANFGGNERNHHQEGQKIVPAGQEGNQKWLFWRQIGFLMRSGSKGKKEPWEMAYPIRRGAACTECAFETAVKPFHNPIGFG
jgi:hypothetical protein